MTTCAHHTCNETIPEHTGPGRPRKYCSKTCAMRAAETERTRTKTCTLDGCNKPLQARGLCSTHYNQQHQPNRHKKVTVTCACCGVDVVKDAANAKRYKNVYCSMACRDIKRTGRGPATDLPEDHWARWYGVADALYTRTCVACGATFVTPWESKIRCHRDCDGQSDMARFTAGSCGECGSTFVAETNGSPIVYCSLRCARRVAKRRRRARQYNAPGDFTYTQVMRQYQRQGYVCAYCKEHRGLPDPEHVIPLSRGGRNDMSNLVAACRVCNSAKGDMTITEWVADRVRRGLPTLPIDLTQAPYLHLHLREPEGKAYRLALAA